MRRWLPFLLPFGAIVAAGVGAWAIHAFSDRRCDAVVPVAFDALPDAADCVAVTGTAHYESVVKQTRSEFPFGGEQTSYLFPLFPPGETEDREVRVLVAAARAPEHLVSYEGMVVEGRQVRATPDLVPYALEIQLGKTSGYFFSDDLRVLFADAIVSDGQRWERP